MKKHQHDGFFLLWLTENSYQPPPPQKKLIFELLDLLLQMTMNCIICYAANKIIGISDWHDLLICKNLSYDPVARKRTVRFSWFFFRFYKFWTIVPPWRILFVHMYLVFKKIFDQKVSATYIKVCCPNWSWNVTKSKLKKTFL